MDKDFIEKFYEIYNFNILLEKDIIISKLNKLYKLYKISNKPVEISIDKNKYELIYGAFSLDYINDIFRLYEITKEEIDEFVFYETCLKIGWIIYT